MRRLLLLAAIAILAGPAAAESPPEQGWSPGRYENGRWIAGPVQGRYDDAGRWIAGAPAGRVSPNGLWLPDPAPGYWDEQHRWRAGAVMGAYDEQGRWRTTAPGVDPAAPVTVDAPASMARPSSKR
jgi:hypothetical protein